MCNMPKKLNTSSLTALAVHDISVFPLMAMVFGTLRGAPELNCRNHSVITARGEPRAEFTVSTLAGVRLAKWNDWGIAFGVTTTTINRAGRHGASVKMVRPVYRSRLHCPTDFSDDVLIRLLELNEQSYKEEFLAGKAVTFNRIADDDDSDPADDEDKEPAFKTKKIKKPRKPKNTPAPGQQEMEF
jgi:hypothetical protein